MHYIHMCQLSIVHNLILQKNDLSVLYSRKRGSPVSEHKKSTNLKGNIKSSFLRTHGSNFSFVNCQGLILVMHY